MSMSDKVELPDIERMFSLIDEISVLSYNKIRLELEIKVAEAEIVKEATSNDKYFVSGKPPSMSYIESTWKVTGFENELVKIRSELAKTSTDLENAKLKFYFYRDLIDLYRTQSANERINLV